MKFYGIYIHIPFCRSKCPYCDFYSMRYSEEKAQQYKDALLRAIEQSPRAEGMVDSIYFGGGTPILMGHDLCEILDRVRARFPVAEDCEITVEANPAVMTLGCLRELHRHGFNRISMGVQSAVDDQLRTLGRLHSAAQARESVELCRIAGFENISVDLMLGTPGQTEDSIDAFCETFCPIVEHISAYLLKVEEGTPFARRHIETQCPDEDESAALYHKTVDTLRRWGFHQYEISNFAKDNRYSRHNTRYWNSTDYLGIGPAAHSFWNGERRYFPRDLDGFIERKNPWDLWEFDTAGGDFFEYAMLRLRLTDGLRFEECMKKYPNMDLTEFRKKAELLAQHGLAVVDEKHAALTTEGFLVSNSAIWSLLESYDLEG